MASAINNRPALRFTGNDILQASVPFDLQDSSAELTLFVVARPAETQFEGVQIVDFTSPNGGWSFGRALSATTPDMYRFQFLGPDGLEGDNTWAQVRTGHVQILTAIKQAKALTLFLNHAQVATSNASADMSVAPNLLTVGGSVANGSQRWKGDLAEVIIYNRALTDTEQQQVTEYLDTKYGIIPNLPIPKKGLRAWFRTDIGVTANSGIVSSWTDYVSGIAATQENSDLRPLLGDDGRGGSTIGFDGIDDILQTSPVDLLGGADDLSVFVVTRPATTSQPALACIVDHNLNEERNPQHGFAVEQDSVVGNKFCLDWLDHSGGQPAASAKVVVATDELHIFTAVKSGTLQEVSVNSGTEKLEAAVDVPQDMLSNRNSLAIGGSVNYSNRQFSGEISAVIIYNRALSACERESVQKYLGDTYSLYGTKFEFLLDEPSTTSAGVYTTDDRLIRTLWRKVVLGPGLITRTWDGKDDDRVDVAPGTYNIKVISHDVQYVWDGVIGNTSTSIVGPGHHAGQTFIHSLAVDDDNNAFYVEGEAEGFPTVRRFDTRSPQTATSLRPNDGLVGFDHIATDGSRVYYSNKGVATGFAHPAFVAASNIDGSPSPFPQGAPIGSTPQYEGCIDVWPGPHPNINNPTGLAVQKDPGTVLAVSHGGQNLVRLFDKGTGQPKGTIAVTNPGELAMTPAGELWILSGTTARSYSNLDSTPKPGPTISGLTAPAAITIRPLPGGPVGGLGGGLGGFEDIETGGEHYEVIIADGGAAQVLKFFDMAGQPSCCPYPATAGGYATRGPDVADDKFLFQVGARGTPVIRTALSATDGTIWVGDGATNRLLRFTRDANGTMNRVDQIMFLVSNQNGDSDPTHPARVIGDGWLEFEVDYTKRLGESGSWTLKKNWAAGVSPDFFPRPGEGSGPDEGLREVTTLSNGRVYATMFDYSTQPGAKAKTVVELPTGNQNLRICKDSNNNNLRLTHLPTAEGYTYASGLSQPPSFERDGSLRYVKIAPGPQGPTVTWYQKDLATPPFDTFGNPRWNDGHPIATAPYRNEDPMVFNEKGWNQNRNPITSSGKIVTFDDTFFYNHLIGLPKTTFPTQHSDIDWTKWKHLGGVALNGTDWSWRSSPSVLTDVPFDGLGSFDIGDGITYAASLAMVQGRNVIYSYHGEFWNQHEASQWMHFYDNGLFIGQFGTSGDLRVVESGAAVPGFTGNSFFPSMVNVDANNQASVNGETYLWTDDKSLHSGVARWHILGANSVREFSGSVAMGGSVMLTRPAPTTAFNVKATPGNGLVELSWLPIEGSNSTYRVKYSTSNGGPYTTAGTTSALAFTVSGLMNGIKYYFVVSADNSPVNSKQVAAFPFATVGTAGEMTGGYDYPLQVISGAPAAGRNSLNGLPYLLGDLTRTNIGHLGYVIYNWADAGTINSQQPVPYTTISNLPGPVSVSIAPGSAWINARDHVLNQFAIDGALGRDAALDLHTNTTGSIDISVSDGATHYVTAFCPLAGGGPRNFKIKITPAGQSSPSPSYTINEAQNFANNHIFQFSFVGPIRLTIENLNADQSACLQALFFD